MLEKFNAKWEEEMKEAFEAVRKEHYEDASRLQTSPEMNNKFRNLIYNYINSAVGVQLMRALSNHRWALSLSKYAGELAAQGHSPPKQARTVVEKLDFNRKEVNGSSPSPLPSSLKRKRKQEEFGLRRVIKGS